MLQEFLFDSVIRAGRPASFLIQGVTVYSMPKPITYGFDLDGDGEFDDTPNRRLVSRFRATSGRSRAATR